MDTSEPQFFGDLLHTYRTTRGKTQRQLANHLRVHRNTIGEWERNSRLPEDRETVVKLARFLSLSHELTDRLLIAALYAPEYHVVPSSPVGGGAKPPELAVVLRNPYKALNAFGPDDADDFFGRVQFINKLVEALKKGQGTRLLALVGASGSGKTSIMMAGVLPRLRAGALPGSRQWLYLRPIVPGAKPLESLGYALSEHLSGKSRDLIEQDLGNPSARGLGLLTGSLVRHPGMQVVLFVDQFEELYQQASEGDAQHFLNLLVSAITEPQSGLLVLLALRADYYDHILAPPTPPAFAQLVQAHQHLVLLMTGSELREVVEEPAKRVGLAFEKPIADEILAEVEGQAGALPLLEFMLYQLVEQSKDHLDKDRIVPLHVYRQLGGVRGALARYAEAEYARLPPERQSPFVRSVFLRLVFIDVETGRLVLVRRRAPLHEFALRDPGKTDAVLEVISHFVVARLLVVGRVVPIPRFESSHAALSSLQDQEEEEQRTVVSTLEVSHEALFQEWPRLRLWVSESREDLPLQQRISRDAIEWEDAGRSRDRLYRGKQFKQARTLAKKNILSKNEEAFLQTSAKRHMQSVMSVIVLILLLVSSLSAAGYYALNQSPDPTRVSTLADDGPRSLRWCINNAKSGSTIRFDASVRGMIHLTSGDLQVNRNLTILGPGAGILAVSSGNTNFGIHIYPKVSFIISGLSFKDVSYSLFTQNNAFISNDGTLQLSSSIISNNSIFSNGQHGSVIFNSNGSTTIISNSTISGNSSFQGAGSIVNVNKGTVIISHSTISRNSAAMGSGGIVNEVGGTVVVSNSTISDNSGDIGGGILNAGTAIVSNSTISGNMASKGDGGGFLNSGIVEDGKVTSRAILSNSTLFKNKAVGNGGGFYNEGGSVDMAFCTIFSNTASRGGGIFLGDFNVDGNGDIIKGQVMMKNSITAANHADGDPDISGTFTSGGYNLIQDSAKTAFTPNTGDQFVPDLSHVFASNIRLSNNGGPTQTLALLTDSNNPALNTIPLTSCQISAIYDEHARKYIDQRGKTRPGTKKPACDIGAYEAQM